MSRAKRAFERSSIILFHQSFQHWIIKKSCALCWGKLAIHCKLSHDASWEIYVKKKGTSVPACHEHLSTSHCYPKCLKMRTYHQIFPPRTKIGQHIGLCYVQVRITTNIEPYFTIGLSGSPTTILNTVIKPPGSIITCYHSWKKISESKTLHLFSISLLEGCLVLGFRTLILSPH